MCYALHNGDEIKFGDIICSFIEQKETNDIHNRKKIDSLVREYFSFVASTQTITNSYDDQEPAQPVKVWTQSNDVTSKG